jgi:hypothetical protein
MTNQENQDEDPGIFVEIFLCMQMGIKTGPFNTK